MYYIQFCFGVQKNFVRKIWEPYYTYKIRWCIYFKFLLFIGFCIICQATTLFFRGKEPMMFYVCLGKIPKEVIELPFKKNSSFTFVLLVSVICYIYILCCFTVQNFQEKKSEQDQSSNLSIQNYLRDRIQKESLFRLVAFVFILFYNWF